LTEQETVADLAAALHLPLVVVTRRSLGTLNHTLLTLEVAGTRGLPVAGVVVNEICPSQTLAEDTNVVELQHRIQVPLLATVPYQAERGTGIPASLEAVDWWKLCSAW
jgi:dethiobiotin synthetase